jgi:rod shape determining protein RodA
MEYFSIQGDALREIGMYFVEKIKGTDFFKQFDYLLFGAVLLLSVIGIVVLRSATMSMADGEQIVFKQLVSIILGIIIALIVSAIDYKDFKILGVVLYIIALMLLVLVLFKGTGRESWGSRSWLNVPVIGSFQPSELAKITVVLITSVFFERMLDGKDVKKNILKIIIYSMLPIALVLAQPDTGTALVFAFALAVMIFTYGIKYRYIFVTIGAFLASLPLLWFFVLEDHQKWRIKTFLNPNLDPLDKGWQVIRSKLAIGSGQIYGKGLFKGIQTQSGGVPIIESDFIFAVIGEELGFIGALIVLAIVFFILLRCLYIAKNSRDYYGSLLVTGLTGMMAFHFFENIGMCIGVLPVTGIPLPFVSAGGSAMVTNYFAIGIILSVSMRRKRTIFNSG